MTRKELRGLIALALVLGAAVAITAIVTQQSRPYDAPHPDTSVAQSSADAVTVDSIASIPSFKSNSQSGKRKSTPKDKSSSTVESFSPKTNKSNSKSNKKASEINYQPISERPVPKLY